MCEVYDRNDPKFYDTPEWQVTRINTHQYLSQVMHDHPKMAFAYYFVWNDYVISGLEKFKGVKWHRHPSEPRYDYETPKCEEFLKKVSGRGEWGRGVGGEKWGERREEGRGERRGKERRVEGIH